jgi:hypothetical protein
MTDVQVELVAVAFAVGFLAAIAWSPIVEAIRWLCRRSR